MDKWWVQLSVNVRLIRAYTEVGHKGVATGRGESSLCTYIFQ
ncbi:MULTISPECIES: hypothetical protein [Virgibacillus]|nr:MULTISPECIES: hypothetical protein [Virgibacillus]WBX80515.1 hypothetical protein PD280_01180 [Virgibacillus salarius]